jgi:hypothetical protein
LGADNISYTRNDPFLDNPQTAAIYQRLRSRELKNTLCSPKTITMKTKEQIQEMLKKLEYLQEDLVHASIERAGKIKALKWVLEEDYFGEGKE